MGLELGWWPASTNDPIVSVPLGCRALSGSNGYEGIGAPTQILMLMQEAFLPKESSLQTLTNEFLKNQFLKENSRENDLK